jgi:Replication-relaxation
MSATRLGRRGLERLGDQLSDRDLLIIHQVADLRLMTARQIETIHFTLADHATKLTAARSSRRVLERLVRDRLLCRLERRVGGVRAGSASYVYCLGPVGQRLLVDQAVDQPRRRFREFSQAVSLHTLAITESVVTLIVAARARQFDLLELEPEPRCWRDSVGPMGVVTTLRPDLFVTIGTSEYEHRWFIEVDLGTESPSTLLRKCAAYEAYYQSGTEQNQHGVFPRVLWQMHSLERATRLRAAIEHSNNLTTALFTTATSGDWLDSLGGTAEGGRQ